MFQKYSELIRKIFNSIFNQDGSSVTLGDYFQTLGYTALIMLSVALCLVIFISLYYLPYRIYIKITKPFVKLINEKMSFEYECAKEKKTEKFHISNEQFELEMKKFRNTKLYFSLGIIFAWVPFAIPTVLFILSSIISIF